MTALPDAPLIGFNPEHAKRVTEKALQDMRKATAERILDEAEKQLAEPISNIEKAASDTPSTVLEKAAFDVARAEEQQAANILAARVAAVRAEVQADTARLIAGPYKRIS